MSRKLSQHEVDFFTAYALHFRHSYIMLANDRKPLAEFLSRNPSALPSLYDPDFIDISFSKEEVSPDEDFIIKTIHTLHLVNSITWKNDIWKTFLIPCKETTVKKGKFKSTYYSERNKYILEFGHWIKENPDLVEIVEAEVVPHSPLSLL